MAKGRDKQGRETKKKKKPKQPTVDTSNVGFRHHTAVTGQPEPPKPTQQY